MGNGDLIEVFKMSYYNVNGLLHKNTGRRSRSGTVNSGNSSTEPRIRDTRNNKQLYPPMIKDIQIVGRFKGHTNVVKSIKFVKDNANSLVYKLISCGYDGKTFVWEFDYKALPKVKRHHPKPSTPRESRPKSIHDRRQILVSPSPLSRMKHNRNKSIDENHLHSSSLTNIANPNSMNMILQDEAPKTTLSTDQIEVVVSLYKSLYDIRLKRHYKKKPFTKQNIISPIVSDKLVPSIEIPLATIDLSGIVCDGKIDSFYTDEFTFWCFAKSGDLFRYVIT